MHTKNPLSNFDAKNIRVKLQENEGDQIRPKKAGRPAKPNMKRVVIKMDETLHKSLVRYAQIQGVPMSSIISIAVKRIILGSDSIL